MILRKSEWQGNYRTSLKSPVSVQVLNGLSVPQSDTSHQQKLDCVTDAPMFTSNKTMEEKHKKGPVNGWRQGSQKIVGKKVLARKQKQANRETSPASPRTARSKCIPNAHAGELHYCCGIILLLSEWQFLKNIVILSLSCHSVCTYVLEVCVGWGGGSVDNLSFVM